MDDTALLDEFHVRGGAATDSLLHHLCLSGGEKILDCGCGLGGAARRCATYCDGPVIGIDAVHAYVVVAKLLSQLMEMGDRTVFVTGDACTLPFREASFHVILSQHLTMNIRHKPLLFGEWYRVLRKGGRIGLNEVVSRTGEPDYPVPWARDRDMSFLVTEEALRDTLLAAGFRIRYWQDRTVHGVHWFEDARGGREGLTLKLVMGPEIRLMTKNLRQALVDGRVGLIEVVAEKEER